ncbi:Auxin-responsive protein SAUR65 [Linum grandiflorum]
MVLPKSLVKLTMQKWIKQLGVMASSSSWNSSTKGGHFVVYTKKGWFVVYSVDRRRYALPLELLENEMFVEMLKMAEEEFGLSNHQSIVFPFDSSVMDRIIDILLISSNNHQLRRSDV